MRSFLLLIFCMSALTAQEPPKAPGSTAPPPTVIRTGTQEVLLDVVVRDKKGKPVRDLEVKDIAVRDDGAPVKITGFRLVTGADASGLGSEAATGPKVLDPMRQVRLVSLVFERLDNDGRRLARQASLEFLKTELEQNVYIAVFIIDQRLHVLQQFTNDRELLRRAVDLASTVQYTQFAAQSDAIRKQLEDAVNKQATTAAAVATPPTGPGAGASGSNFGAGEAAAKMAQMTLNMLQFEESLSRVQQSRSSIFALLSLVRAQGSLPGRKTLIYFSEGLQVPDSMIENFNSTIGAANRAGVSVYAVDARGLTSEGQSGAGKSMLDSAVASSRAQQTAGGRPSPVTMDQARVFDTARDSVHANTQEALEELAANTGGFLVANTNDFRAPFRKVSEDVHAYYEVAYVPPITDYDGHFRKVSVVVDRPDVRVQTRSGYFALPPNENSVFAYEIPLLRALNSTPLPKDFPFHAAALRFGRENGNVEYGLVMEVPLKDVTFTEDKVSHNYRAHLSLVALFKDQRGTIVERFSRDLPLEEPADKLDALRHGDFIQTYHLALAPGRYTLDSAVMDRESQKISARRTAVMVMAPRPGIGMSSLSLIRRIEPQSGDVDVQDPFHFEGGKVVPTLDDSVQASAGGELSYYFVIYPLNTVADKPQLTMEFIKDGTTVGQASPELPPAGKDGVIPYVAALPLTSFGPGTYELHTIIKQGSSVAEERTSFSINP